MRIIKLIIVSALFFFLLLTAMSLLIPSHVRISRAINLPVQHTHVMSFVEDTATWKQWHPFFKDRSIQDVLSQNQVQWETKQKNDSLFVMSLTQKGHAPVENTWQLHSLASADSIALQWYMDFRLSWYPWQKFGSLFYEKTYGTMMEQGLYDVKRILAP